MKNATPRPWAETEMGHIDGPMGGGEARTIAEVDGMTVEEMEDNTNLIVTAVNAHDALVAAVESFMFDGDCAESKELGRKALKAAGVKS